MRFEVLFPHLDERQRRLLMGAEARILGHGGIRTVAQAAEVSETTVRKGVEELEAGAEPLGRVRRPGGGRKRVADLDPGLRTALLGLVEPDMRGDPMSPLRWTTKSPRNLAAELTRQGHRVCADVVGDLLREEGFSLQGNAKTMEGKQHPDRDGQFRYINEQAREFQQAGDPVISVPAPPASLDVGSQATHGRGVVALWDSPPPATNRRLLSRSVRRGRLTDGGGMSSMQSGIGERDVEASGPPGGSRMSVHHFRMSDVATSST